MWAAIPSVMHREAVPLRVGVVGLGFGRAVHVPALRCDARCRLVAICGTSADRARRIARELDIEQAFGDWARMLDEGHIQAVTIATPPSVQPSIAQEALSRGIAVFAEKPLSLTLSDARALADAAARAGRANMVDFAFLGAPAFQAAKAQLSEQRLGPLRHCIVQWHVETYANRMGLSSWKTDAQQGGGALLNFVPHAACYVMWLLGPIDAVSALLSRAPGDGRTADSMASLNLRLTSGVTCSVNVTTNSILGSGHRITIAGDEGTLVLENSGSDYVSGLRLYLGARGSDRLEPVDVQGLAATTDGRIAAVSVLMQRWIDWALDGPSQQPDFRQGAEVQAVLDAAVRSNADGGRLTALA